MLKINPFVYRMKVDLIKINTTIFHVTSVEGMYEAGDYSSTHSKTVETSKFTKLYKLSYASGFLKELGNSGRHLFLYILYRLNPDEDKISLPPVGVCSELGVSERTYYNAINDLISMSVIERENQNKGNYNYWINPIFFFAGDRKEYFKKNNPDALEVVKVKNVTKRVEDVK